LSPVLQESTNGSRKNLLLRTDRTLGIIPRSLREGEVQPCKHGAEFPFSSTAMMPMTKNWHRLFQEGRESVPAANSALNKELYKQMPG